MGRPIFIRNLPPEYELDPSFSLQLLKSLYGLSESGSLWHETLAKHHLRKLFMTTLRIYPTLYVLNKERSLIGISGTYVYYIMRTGDT